MAHLTGCTYIVATTKYLPFGPHLDRCYGLGMQTFLSLRDIAEAADIPLNTVKSLERRGQLPAHDVEVGLGGHQRVSRGWSQESIDRWLEQRQ